MIRSNAAISVCRSGIPPELIARPQWVVWRLEATGNRQTKIPYQLDGRKASSTDPKTWTTFDKAFQLFEQGKFDGVGFVFSADDPYLGIDLDACRNPATGALTPWANQIVQRIDSYTEISPSGTGVKVIARARLA